MMRRLGNSARTAPLLAVLCLLLSATPAVAQAPDTREVGPVAGPTETTGEMSGEVAGDPEVEAAWERLVRARRQVARVEAALDAAARGYERARAHHARLTEELVEARRLVERVHERQEQERALQAARVREAYKNPERALSLSAAVLRSRDAGDALHRAALLRRSTVQGAVNLDRGQRSADLLVEAERQMRVIADGTRRSAQERQQATTRLQRVMVELSAERAAAEEALTAARAEAERRLESSLLAWDAANRERTFDRLLAAARGAPPPPVVDGRVCPIGAPNGFVDSWGAPRSGGRRHKGVDIFAAYGMPLFAVADGVVVKAGEAGLGGLRLQLVDDRGDRFYYAHLSSLAVREGERVERGQLVGTNGNSGNARTTPPHLHWQFHPGGGEAVNPYPLAAALCRGADAPVRQAEPLEEPPPAEPAQTEPDESAEPVDPGEADAADSSSEEPAQAGEPAADADVPGA